MAATGTRVRNALDRGYSIRAVWAGVKHNTSGRGRHQTGHRDQPQILPAADRLAAGIPNPRQARIADAAHLVHMEQPAAFNRLVLSFLHGV